MVLSLVKGDGQKEGFGGSVWVKMSKGRENRDIYNSINNKNKVKKEIKPFYYVK